jgi:hypothetical protein
VLARVPVFVPWHVSARDSVVRWLPQSRSARFAVAATATSVASVITIGISGYDADRCGRARVGAAGTSARAVQRCWPRGSTTCLVIRCLRSSAHGHRQDHGSTTRPRRRGGASIAGLEPSLPRQPPSGVTPMRALSHLSPWRSGVSCVGPAAPPIRQGCSSGTGQGHRGSQ